MTLILYIIKVIWVCCVHGLEYMLLQSVLRSSPGLWCTGCSWLLTALLMAVIIEMFYLTFSDYYEHLTYKMNLCTAGSLTLSRQWEEINNYASCLCLTVWACVTVSSISSPSSALGQRRKLSIKLLVSSVLFCWILFCLGLAWAHTCGCMFLSMEECRRPWRWPLGMRCQLISP